MASWYDDAWAFRAPITFLVPSATYKGDYTIPKDWDDFWANVQSDGDDIRITYADGRTACVFQLQAGFSTATRTGTVTIYASDGIASSRNVVWIYWGNASATSASGVVASGGNQAITPRETPTADRVVALIAESPDATQPSQTIRKGSGETIWVYVDVTDALMRRSTPFESSDLCEGVHTITTSATLAGASATATIASVPQYDALIEASGRQYVRVQLSAGSSGTTYTVIVTIRTMLNATSSALYEYRILTARFLLSVYDVSEV